MSAKVLLSYRRRDSSGHCGRIFDRLAAAFGSGTIFRDVESISPGHDFVRTIEKAIGGCAVVLVVIGPDWLANPDENGPSRLEDPNDLVRLEVATALRSDVSVIPILVGDATMPDAADLPGELKPLTRSNAMEIRNSHYETDLRSLVSVLEERTGLRAKQLRRSPVVWLQMAVCLAAGALSYFWPPPADLTAGGSRAAGPVAAIVILAGAVVLAIFHTKQAGGAAGRIIAVALGLLGVGASAVVGYQWLSSSSTVRYESTPVVVGSKLTPMAQQYLAANPETTLEQLVMDAGGEVERLWTRDSIRRNVLLLRTVHAVVMAVFLACVLAFLQAVRLKR